MLDLNEDVPRTADNIAAFAPGSQGGFRDFMKLAEKLHEVSEKFFFWRSVEDIGDTLDLRKNMDLATLRDVLSLRMGTTVAGTIRRRVRDGRVAQMLDHFVQYVGSSPVQRAGRAVRHRAYADGRRRLVSDGRHPRGAGGAAGAGERSRR